MNTASPARALFTSISKKSWARCTSCADRKGAIRLARQKQNRCQWSLWCYAMLQNLDNEIS